MRSAYQNLRPASEKPPEERHEAVQSESQGSRPAPRQRGRKNVSHACNRCRKMKSRCNGSGPPCRRCEVSGSECVYSRQDRRVELKSAQEVELLRSRIQDLEATLRAGDSGTVSKAAQAPQPISINPEHDTDKAHRLACLESNDIGFQSAIPLLSNAELYQVRGDRNARPQQRDLLASSASGGSALSITPPMYTPSILPPQDIVRKGAEHFFVVISGMFYVMDPEDFETLCRKVYSNEYPPDLLAICEICAVASVGSQYCPWNVSDDVKDALFRTSAQYINDLIDADPIRAMRSLACLSGYGIVEKRRSTRVLIHTGLEIARWSKQQYVNSAKPYSTWKKLYRTMVYLECWLSTSLGYHPDFNHEETTFVTIPTPETFRCIDDSAQEKLTEIGILKAEVLEVYASGSINSAMIDRKTKALEDWAGRLPSFMQLSALLGGSIDVLSGAHKGAMLFAHAKFLSSIMLLHRPALIAVADWRMGIEWKFPGLSLEQTHEYHQHCITAARTAVRILVLTEFGSSKTLSVRCWLCHFELFTACTVLLYSIALEYLLRPNGPTEVKEDLERTRACLKMLQTAANADQVAERLVARLHPVHHQLEFMYAKAKSAGLGDNHLDEPSVEKGITGKGAIGATNSFLKQISELSPSPGRLQALQPMREALEVMKDPFGHGSEAGLVLISRQSDNLSPDWWMAT